MLTADFTRCLGQMGFASDSYICPRRMTCLRHLDAPTDPDRSVWAMHLCRPKHDAYIPIAVLTEEVA